MGHGFQSSSRIRHPGMSIGCGFGWISEVAVTASAETRVDSSRW